MKEQLQIVVIGPGKHATEHLIPQIITHPHARVAGLVGRDAKKLSAIAERYNIGDFSDDWSSYLRKRKFDAVVMSAPPPVHVALLEEVIPLKIPTFVEKPPAQNADDLLRLSELQEANKTDVIVGYNFLHSDGYVRLRRRAGNPTNISYARISLFTNKPVTQLWNFETIVQSLLYAVGIHGLSIVNDIFFDCRVSGAHCVLLEGGRMYVHVTLASKSGQLVVFELGNHAASFEAEIELVMTDSSRYILIDWSRIIYFPAASGYGSYEVEDIFSVTSPASRGGYFNILNHFINNVREAKTGIRNLAWSIPIYENINRILECLRDAPASDSYHPDPSS